MRRSQVQFLQSAPLSFIIINMEKTKLSSLYTSFFKIGLFTFGGGLAMLPMFEKEICDKHKWTDSNEIMDYYSISQMTPGVIAVNVATFVGNKERGVIGGIVSTLGVISPSVLLICIIAAFINNIYTYPAVQSLLKGLACGVCALIVPSLIKFFKSSIHNAFAFINFAICLALILFTNIPKVLIIVAAILFSIIINIKELKK